MGTDTTDGESTGSPARVQPELSRSDTVVLGN